jgi:hypothetical protein
VDSQVVTLKTMISTVRHRADIVTSQFIDDPELTGYLNDSATELWDLLVAAYGEEYQTASAVLTTTGAGTIPLPSDFLKSEGPEVAASAGGAPRSLKRIPWSDRNKMISNWTGQLAAYCIRGPDIWLFPSPPAGQQVTIYYVPRAPVLASTASVVIAAPVQGTDHFYINGVDVTLGAAASTAAAFATAIGLAITNDTPNDATWGLTTGTVTNPDGTVTLTITLPDAGMVVTWYGTNPLHFRTSSYRVANMLDGVDGWSEYVVLDAIIKCKAKDDEDSGTEERAKEAMLQRIKAASANRDAGGIPVADTRASDDPYFGSNSRWGY